MTLRSISIPGLVSVEEAEGIATPCNVGMLCTVISGSAELVTSGKIPRRRRIRNPVCLY